MIARIKAVLPDRWFGDVTPVLDAVLAGPGLAWSAVYSSVQSAMRQLRFRAAEGRWLDALGKDFFGSAFERRADEADDRFRFRLLSELMRERATRLSVRRALLDLTGREPDIFEPSHCGDTGAYASISHGGGTSLAYGAAGGWGSLNHPFQVFVTAYRPDNGVNPGGVGWGGGGYNLGQVSYTDMDSIRGRVTDRDINAAVRDVMPIGTLAWVRITG